jgi:hypothetical protein
MAERSPETNLIFLEMEPILEKERARVRLVFRALEDLKHRLDLFSETDEPHYEIWVQTEFGARLSKIRELRSRHSELRTLIGDVELHALEFECSEAEAYERVIKIREGVAKADEFRRQHQEAGDSASCDLPPEVEEMLRLSFEKMMGGEPRWGDDYYEEIYSDFVAAFRKDALREHGDETDSTEERERFHREEQERHRSRQEGSKRARKKSNSDESSEVRLKKAYRSLARKLHPDANPNQTKIQKELWQEVQEAYVLKDTGRLEALLTMVDEGGTESGDMAVDKIRSVSRLRKLVDEFGKKIRSLEKALRKLKKQPAWDFQTTKSDPKRMRKLRMEISRELHAAEDEIAGDVAVFEDVIHRWTARRKRRKFHSAYPTHPMSTDAF